MSKTRRFTILAMLGALAATLNIIESIFIPPLQFGIRFGLANILAMITISLFGIKETMSVNALRVVVGNLLKGSLFATNFWISASGVLLSTLCLALAKKMKTSFLFMSVFSSLAHSIGQLLMVIMLYSQVGIFSLLPLLLISSLGTGLLTGSIAQACLRRIRL